MALTRKLLESLGLDERQADAVIEAHVGVTDALKHERDELRTQAGQAGDAARIQAEFDAYRAQTEAERLRGRKADALRGALREAGVRRESFVELLVKAVDLDQIKLDSGRICEPETVVGPLREAFGDCFATTLTQGASPLDPPGSGRQRFTREDIAGMSVEDINANWPAVRAAIGQE